MAKTVEYHNPDFEDGIIFDVGGLAIPNGGSIELSEEDELTFYAKKQMDVSEYFQNEKLVKVSGKSEISKSDKTAHTAGEVSTEPPNLDDVVAPDAGENVEHSDDDKEA